MTAPLPRFVTGADLPAQWTSGPAPVTVLRPIAVDLLDASASAAVDKPHQALWTSPGEVVQSVGGTIVDTAWDDDAALAWTRIVPAAHARIAVIDTLADADALAATYPAPPRPEFNGLDPRVVATLAPVYGWAQMACDGIDGVWLTADGNALVHHAWRENAGIHLPHPMSCWDVESVAWLRTDLLATGQTVERERATVWPPGTR